MKSTRKIILLGTLLSLPVTAEVNVNGFATMAGGLTTSSDETLYGYDSDSSFAQDSVMGIQISGDVGEGLTATAQLISRGSEDWNVEAEWAYISYEATDYLKILAGKQRSPYYMYSDYVDVDYAYHWITPPQGVYSLPFDSTTGVGMHYTRPIGNLDSTVQVVYGRNKKDLDLGALETRNSFSLAWTLTYDWLTLRASHSAAELDIDISNTLDLNIKKINTLVNGWTFAGFPELADELLIAEEDVTFDEIGISIDYNNLLIVAELTQLKLGDTFLSDQESSYISVAYRLEKFTPHITYGRDEDTPETGTFAGVPWGVAPALDLLRAKSEALVASQEEDSDYITVGVRWDFHDSAALKMEYTEFNDGFRKGATNTDASLFRIAITTVF